MKIKNQTIDMSIVHMTKKKNQDINTHKEKARKIIKRAIIKQIFFIIINIKEQ